MLVHQDEDFDVLPKAISEPLHALPCTSDPSASEHPYHPSYNTYQPHISFHAMVGHINPKALRLKGKLLNLTLPF